MQPHEFDFNATDACISFLPLSHITARALDYVMYGHGAQVAYCSQFDKLPQAMKEVRPTVFVGVPRVYEKIRQAVEQKSAASPVKKRMLAWALNVGERQPRHWFMRGRQPSPFGWKLANKLVYSKVREAFGGRVRSLFPAERRLGIDTAQLVRLDAGIAVWEGYGLTETSPVIALNTPVQQRMGSVGKPLPNVELKFAEDGELLVRGPSVFVGLLAEAGVPTRSVSMQEGWFRTGDIAHLDDRWLSLHHRPQEGTAEDLGRQAGGAAADREQAQEQCSGGAGCAGRRQAQVHLGAYFAQLCCAGRVGRSGMESTAGNRAELVADSRVVALYSEIVRDGERRPGELRDHQAIPRGCRTSGRRSRAS